MTREFRKGQDHSQALAEKGWYHSFELPDGTLIDGVNPIARQRERYARFPIPADLGGKRVLDIGAWDGWFSFEAERHGASVTSIDCVEVDHFLDLHRKLSSKADYRVLEVYELPEAGLGRFDIVFFLGVLYHLRHPLLALEIVCGLTTDVAVVESFVTDGETWREHQADIPVMEFYESCELAGQFDNWCGPSVACLMAMCRAAGFARVELLHTEPNNAMVACYRGWEAEPAAPATEAPQFLMAVNTAGQGINFRSRKEQYLSCWFRGPRAPVSHQELRLEVDGFGAACDYCKSWENGLWVANFPLPRGLSPGWKQARLRYAGSGFSNAVRIAVDLPVVVERLVCLGVRDGITWEQGQVRASGAARVACWAAGLPENADCNNVRLLLGATRLRIEFLGEPDAHGRAQINAALPPDVPRGEHLLFIECGGVRAEPCPVQVV